MSRDQNIQETLQILPGQPGVYLMRDETATIIYVGKAKVLKNRVRSYFHGPKDAKTTVLVQRVRSIDWIVTRNEYEALILENNLIKQHRPRYNISLKDGKTYPFIRITNEDFPRVFRTRRVIEDGSSYFGPYPKVQAIDTYLELIEQYFPLRKCQGPLKKRAHPCLYHHIGRCGAPCTGAVTVQEYGAQVGRIKRLLSGETEELAAELQTKMGEASTSQRFEEAAKLRDGLKAIEGLGVEQQVQDFDPDARDYIAWDIREELVSFVVLRMRGGRMIASDVFRTEGLSDENELGQQFFLQYYTAENPPPPRLYLPLSDMHEELRHYCATEFGLQVEFPDIGARRDASVLEMARENARQDIRKRVHDSGNIQALKELQRVLELPKIPMRIEGFDIAHLHGKHTVAAMVSFYKGLPDNQHYRIFNIRSLGGGIDDFQSIREAVARRYTRVLNEDLERPDLILIDGGKGQLSAAHEVLTALGLEDIPLVAIAKEHEELFRPGDSEPQTLPEGTPALRILQHVRDETHRFGTTRNQNLRSGDLRLSILETVPGIGPKRAAALLETFGGLDQLRAAGVLDFRVKGGLPEKAAKALFEALQGSVADQPAMAAEPEPNYGEGEEV